MAVDRYISDSSQAQTPQYTYVYAVYVHAWYLNAVKKIMHVL
jgi:hypothetical protein